MQIDCLNKMKQKKGDKKIMNWILNSKKSRFMLHSKKGALTDIFIFMIFAVVILLFSGIFIYLGVRVNSELHSNLDKMSHGEVNYNATITQTMGKVSSAYKSLYWISIFLIVAMIISIFVGSYIITTKSIYFVPYIFIIIIALVVSVGISNAYITIIETPELRDTFNGFLGANYIMYYLPLWIVLIGFTGGIIMFVKMKSEEYVPTYG